MRLRHRAAGPVYLRLRAEDGHAVTRRPVDPFQRGAGTHRVPVFVIARIDGLRIGAVCILVRRRGAERHCGGNVLPCRLAFAAAEHGAAREKQARQKDYKSERFVHSFLFHNTVLLLFPVVVECGRPCAVRKTAAFMPAIYLLAHRRHRRVKSDGTGKNLFSGIKDHAGTYLWRTIVFFAHT